MIKEGKRDLDEDVYKMWNEMATCFKIVAKDSFQNLKDVDYELRRLGG